MSIGPGQTLLHYRIVEKIGEGGMGQVWKAVDTTLDRPVAIKVVPESFAFETDRLARFEREAKLLASLNHPGIAVVHGLHTHEGGRFLAMELVAGEDLARRLARGRLSVAEVVTIGRQVAEAVEAAHEQGVVHRDLKPGNVLVDSESRVKVLDFGLAKNLEADAGTGSHSLSPTLTSPPTAAGVLLGTASYMSPEQVRGQSVDKRGDVWAFGCVLYEMLAGERPFPGATISDTLASVLKSEPGWERLPASLPPPLGALVRRCLTKDRRRRLRDIGEARIVLEDLERGVPEESIPTATARRRWLAVAAVAGLGLLLFAAGYALHTPAEVASGINSEVRVRRVTFDPGLEQEPTLSPDGNYLAFTTDDAGNLDVVVLPIAGGDSRRITDSDADDAQPAWSPDGTRLAFVSARERTGRLAVIVGLRVLSTFVHGYGGDIFLVPALGGTPVKLVDDGCYPAWSPDGQRIVFQSRRGGAWDLWVVPVSGGEPQRLTEDELIDYQPRWSPDGRWIAFASTTGTRSDLRVVPADGGQPVVLAGAVSQTGAGADEMVLGPEWSDNGRWIFFSSDHGATSGVMNLWRVRFDAARPERPGVRQRVTMGEGSDVGTTIALGGRRLAFSSVRFSPDIWDLTLARRELRRITAADSNENYPHMSPDGRTLVMQADRGGDRTALWTLTLDDGIWSQWTTGDFAANAPRWSPDGKRVVFLQIASNGDSTIAIAQAGALSASRLASVAAPDGFLSAEWSPDGQHIVAGVGTPPTHVNLRIYDLDGRARDLTHLDGNNSFPSWSRDGRIVFQREVEGPRQLWVVPAEGGEPRAITTDDGTEYSHPGWHPRDPDRILVVIDHKNLATVSASTGAVELLTDYDESTVVLDYPSWSPDGERVYFSLARKTGDLFLLENY